MPTRPRNPAPRAAATLAAWALGALLQCAALAVVAAPLDLLRTPASAAGDPLTVVVGVGDAGALGVSQLQSLLLNVSYDPASLEFVSARAGSAFPAGAGAPSVLANAGTPGSLTVGLASASGAVAVGNGSALVVLEFRVAAGVTAAGELSVGSVSVDIDESVVSVLLDGPGLLDGDADGVNDAFESVNGFDPTDPGDAALDPDGDGVSTLDEVLAGSNPRDAGSVPGPPYVAGDLAGTWHLYGFGDDAAQPSAPWGRACTLSLDAAGAAAGGCDDLDGATQPLAAGNLAITLGATGEVMFDGPFADAATLADAHMDFGRTVIARIAGVTSAGVPGEQVLEVALERGSGYRQPDLAGTWHLFQFGDGVVPAGVDASFWVRDVLHLDASGALLPDSARHVDVEPATAFALVSGGASLAPDGAVQTTGELASAAVVRHERMDAGKTVIAGVTRESFAGGDEVDDSVRVWVKQGSGYQPSDAAGVWYAYAISDAAGVQDPLVSTLHFRVDAVGAASGDVIDGDGDAFSFTGTMEVSDALGEAGRVTLGGDLFAGFTHQHLRMDAGRTVVTGVFNEDDAGVRRPGLLVAVKSVASPPRVVFPMPGSVLDDTVASFAWTDNSTGAAGFQLYVGSTPGASDIALSAVLPAGTRVARIGALPNDGRTVHVRLWYLDGTWKFRDYQYAAYTDADPNDLPAIVSPVNGAKLTANSATLRWVSNGERVTDWQLYVGTTPGGQDLFASPALAAGVTQLDVDGVLPLDGTDVFARLWFRIAGAWRSRDFQYEAAGTAPAITAPTLGSTLDGASATFAWTASGNAVSEWQLRVGTTPGGQQIFASGALAGGTTSQAVSGLPVDGSTLHVQLLYRVGGIVKTRSYSYTAVDFPPPVLTSPAPGTTLTGTSATFQWVSNGQPVQNWQLYVGTSVGGTQIFTSAVLAAGTLSQNVPVIAPTGQPLHVRLWSLVNGAWSSQDYQYTAAPPPPAPILTGDACPTFTSASHTFSWSTNGNVVGGWYLYVGTSVGGSQVYGSGQLSAGTLSQTVTTLPTNGSAVNVRLWYLAAGTWKTVDYLGCTTAVLPDPEITAPTPGAGTTLAASNQAFSWTANGKAVQNWQLYVGTSVGGNQIFTSAVLAAGTLSQVVASIPPTGQAVHVRLWSLINGAWSSRDYQYTAAAPPPAPILTGDACPTFTSASHTFSWSTNGNVVGGWYLYVGTSVGGSQVYGSGQLSAGTLSQTVTTLPTNGSAVNVRLWYLSAGTWKTVDYVGCTTAVLPDPEITAPTPGAGTTLAAANQVFGWTANGKAVQNWQLYVGTSVGGNQIFTSAVLSAGTLSQNVPVIAPTGQPVHVRLWIRINGAWSSKDYQYTAAAPPPAPILTGDACPTFTSASHTFSWSANGNVVAGWYLYVGTSVGGSQVYGSGQLSAGTLSQTVTTLPTNGSAVNVRLWYLAAGTWKTVDYLGCATVVLPEPALTTPAPSSTLPGPSVTFNWITNGKAVQNWQLYVGTSVGGNQIFTSAVLAVGTLSQVVASIPPTGQAVHVRLWYRINGVWSSKDYQYTAAPPPPAPILVGDACPTFSSASHTFSWSANGNVATAWYLYVGTSVGGSEVFNSGQLAGGTLSQAVTTLPTNGSNVNVRLWYLSAGTWKTVDYLGCVTVVLPEPALTTPAPSSTLPGPSVTFNWITNGKAVQNWQLYVGTSVGGNQVYASPVLPSSTLSQVVSGLPSNGSALHVRLWYRIAGTWKSADVSYATLDQRPLIQSPTPGAALGGASASFTWSANGNTVTDWYLYLGSTIGASNYHNSGALAGATTTRSVTTLPVDGSTVYARLWYRINGAWTTRDFTYTAADQRPVITAPAPLATLAGSSVTFQWSAGSVSVTDWTLYAGSTAGGTQYHNSGSLSAGTLSREVAGLPANGSTVHVRLWYRSAGAWKSRDFTYSAASGG